MNNIIKLVLSRVFKNNRWNENPIELINGIKRKKLKKARLGENIAKKYLQRKGYRIIEQNYRTRYAEIDLVAKHKNTLVFVEVRTKQDERYGSPEETINRVKINKLIRNARGYMGRKACYQMSRIDAICIVLGMGGRTKRISHYENIAFCYNNNSYKI